jgi:pilus assembly protein Flp/PilA
MLINLKNKLVSILRREDGQGMVEYALLLALIAVVVIAVLVIFGQAIAAKFTQITNSLQ